MKMRKIIAVLAAVLMLLSILPMAVFAADTYELASSIAVGDTVVLVCTSKKMELNGISTTSTKYGLGVAYTSAPAGAYALEVEAGSTSGTYSFKCPNGQYLYWTSGNSLTTNATKSANTSWTVTFSGDNAIIKNAKDTKRQIFWNSSSPRFACYDTTTQQPVQLFKLVTGGTDEPECEHVWVDADCDTPKTCSECGETEGEALGHSYKDGVCAVCQEKEPEGFRLVTSVNQLVVGSQVIIVAAESNYAMSTDQKSNNRGQVAITKENGVIAPVDTLEIFTLEKGTIDGTYAFKTNDGYIFAASSGSNYLRTETNLSANSSWQIAITDGVTSIVAQGSNTRNVLQHNESSSLFACYSSASQKAVALYIIPAAGDTECEHDYVGAETQTPTCGADGVMTYTCSKCQHSYTEAISATGAHNYDGYVCSVCGAIDYPAADSTLTILEANALGAVHANKTFSDKKYYVEGKVTKIENTQYGNLYIADEEGNQLLIYGTYSADGETRFDAMDDKPVVGDTIKVYGVIGRFDPNNEMKNGWIVGHTKHDCAYDNAFDTDCNICGAIREVSLPITSGGKSASEDVSGVAALFNIDVEGLAIKEGTKTEADFTNAYVGEYKLTGMGAIASNGTSETEISVVYLYELSDEAITYAIRVINIPADKLDVEITFTPYFVVEIDGVATTIYGEVVTATYNSVIGNLL